jgi:aspartate carbamoyltransferase catalytic subunit
LTGLARRHVLDLDDFAPAEIEQVLDTAVEMREVLRRPIKRVPALRGKTIVNMFYEASTRTRVSFELAGKNLSADVVNVSASGSSVEKGESIVDTMQTLEALGADTIVIRHSQSGAPYLAAAHTSASIVNAGDGWHAHPTQALLDLYTIRERFGRVDGLTVVIVGDILHSRVARSDIWGLTRMGARVVLSAPHSLLPDLGPNADAAGCGCVAHLPSVTVEPDLDRAIEGADVVMALRMQRERQTGGLLPSLREYIRRYQLDRTRLARARPDALVMHPGPMNEGVEIAPDVAHGGQSAIADQVTNGVAVRMALLYLLGGEAVDGL